MKGMNRIGKIGIVAMPRISVGGGFARVTRDLIAVLNNMGGKVYLLNPFKVDRDKISKLYGPIKIEKVYGTNPIKALFCREDILGRKLMKKQFQKMAREVDFIIDMDGGVLHRYLPEEFNKKNYVIWRVSCLDQDSYKIQKVGRFTKFKILLKKIVKSITESNKDIPKGIKVYPIDKWTKKEIILFWKINPQKMCFYPEIKINEFNPHLKKSNQAVIVGRITPNKSIDYSIKIFANATKNYLNYRLVIIGGVTPDTEKYLIKLSQLIKDLGIEKRVIIIKDPSFEQIKNTLAESKIHIDSQIGASMSMPVVESLASGCDVFMRTKSGTYTEILGNGKWGTGFNDVEDGSIKMEKAIRQIEKYGLKNKESIKRTKFFSEENFRKRLEKIINK